MTPILKANGHVIYRTTGLATVTAVERDGTPAARYEVAEHPTGSLFCPPSAAIANDLISQKVATPANLTGKTLVLASAVLGASTARDAALDGLNCQRRSGLARQACPRSFAGGERFDGHDALRVRCSVSECCRDRSTLD